MQTNSSKFARRYDREFKQNAVALIQSGRSVSEVARELGVCFQTVKLFLLGFFGFFPGGLVLA